MGLYENMLSEKVTRLALREPVTLREYDIIHDAIVVMRQRKLGCAIVIDEQKKPLGLFSESELTRLLNENHTVIYEPLAKYIKRDWPTVRVSDPITKVLDALESHNVRFLIVVDEQDQLVGLTGQKGLMEYVAEHFPEQVLVQRIGGNPYLLEREGA